jgi:GNAT superfamily N-acetyltransferase
MSIVAYEPELAEIVTEAYNEAVIGVPHCYPVSADEMNAIFAPAPEAIGPGRWEGQRVLVACDRDRVQGFIHTARVPSAEPGALGDGVIRFFWYRRGQRRVGQALLAEAEALLRQDGASRVASVCHYDHRYPFYHIEHAYLSDRMDHVHALLGYAGYTRGQCQMVLDWPDFTEPAPGPMPEVPGGPVEVTVQREAWHGRQPLLVIKAMRGDDEIGICVNNSGAEYSSHPDAARWVYTRWLGVAEAARGCGLGLWLLQRGLVEARAEGYRHAVICTIGDNYRAFLLYSNHGYRAVDWSYTWSKMLT